MQLYCTSLVIQGQRCTDSRRPILYMKKPPSDCGPVCDVGWTDSDPSNLSLSARAAQGCLVAGEPLTKDCLPHSAGPRSRLHEPFLSLRLLPFPFKPYCAEPLPSRPRLSPNKQYQVRFLRWRGANWSWSRTQSSTRRCSGGSVYTPAFHSFGGSVVFRRFTKRTTMVELRAVLYRSWASKLTSKL